MALGWICRRTFVLIATIERGPGGYDRVEQFALRTLTHNQYLKTIVLPK
jgi:hypothetical protein